MPVLVLFYSWPVRFTPLRIRRVFSLRWSLFRSPQYCPVSIHRAFRTLRFYYRAVLKSYLSTKIPIRKKLLKVSVSIFQVPTLNWLIWNCGDRNWNAINSFNLQVTFQLEFDIFSNLPHKAPRGTSHARLHTGTHTPNDPSIHIYRISTSSIRSSNAKEHFVVSAVNASDANWE